MRVFNHYCDICGKNLKGVPIVAKMEIQSFLPYPSEEYDLCPLCFEHLKERIEEERKKHDWLDVVSTQVMEHLKMEVDEVEG